MCVYIYIYIFIISKTKWHYYIDDIITSCSIIQEITIILNSPIPVHFSSLIPRMSMFTLTISYLTTSNLPWFMDLTFQVPMHYCSLQHQTLLLSPVPSRSDRQSAWWTMDGGWWHCIGDRNQDHPQEKEMQKSKMVVWGGLTNSSEKKRSEKQRRKGKIYPSECRVPKNSKER